MEILDAFFGKRKMHPDILGRNAHVRGCFFHRKVNALRYMNRIRKARKPGGVKKAVSSRVGPKTHAFT